MKPFIDELSKEHEEIIQRLQKAKLLGVHTMEGRNYLSETRNLLISHLDKEDDTLFPTLRKAAKIDKRLEHQLNIFDDEMQGISQFCVRFFEKYEANGGGVEFLRDFDLLAKSLENRINKEETVLYAHYRNLN